MDNGLWEERFQNHSVTIKEYENRISNLETFEASTRERIDGLIKSVEDLTSTMRWFMGILITSFVGFFFAFVQGLV